MEIIYTPGENDENNSQIEIIKKLKGNGENLTTYFSSFINVISQSSSLSTILPVGRRY